MKGCMRRMRAVLKCAMMTTMELWERNRSTGKEAEEDGSRYQPIAFVPCRPYHVVAQPCTIEQTGGRKREEERRNVCCGKKE